MRFTYLQATDFLSFKDIHIDLHKDQTIFTGPNGVGKTNIGRCVDMARAVVCHPNGLPDGERIDLYSSAGFNGSDRFTVELGVEIDQEWERALVSEFVKSVFICGNIDGESQKGFRPRLDDLVGRFFDESSLAPLWSGSLKVSYHSSIQGPWWAAWEFTFEEEIWHIPLVGAATHGLAPGPAQPFFLGDGGGPGLTKLMLEAAGMPTDESVLVAEPKSDLSFHPRIKDPTLPQSISFGIAPSTANTNQPIPRSIMRLAKALQKDRPENQSFVFGEVMSRILWGSIVPTDNRRVPFKRVFEHPALEAPVDLRDGANTPAELFRLKNGQHQERQKYERVVKTFERLTGLSLGLHAKPTAANSMTIEPTILFEGGERPIEFSGAGVQEALVLSTLLAGPDGRVFILDEPAVNLEPTMQRRLISALRTAGQSLVITHSPDMVPISERDDLANIVRLASGAEGSDVRRIGSLSPTEWARMQQLMEPAHVRALLFSACVLLCEGVTERRILPYWWRDTTDLGLPNPEAANMTIISVDGQKGFGAYVNYLDAFGIPWAIIADGPAMMGTSVMAKQLQKAGHGPDEKPTGDDFDEWKEYWAQVGAFTLADQFGNDGSKQGEIEAYLERVDSQLFTKLSGVAGQSKPQLGMLFASQHDRPKEVAELYKAIMAHIGNVR